MCGLPLTVQLRFVAALFRGWACPCLLAVRVPVHTMRLVLQPAAASSPHVSRCAWTGPCQPWVGTRSLTHTTPTPGFHLSAARRTLGNRIPCGWGERALGSQPAVLMLSQAGLSLGVALRAGEGAPGLPGRVSRRHLPGQVSDSSQGGRGCPWPSCAAQQHHPAVGMQAAPSGVGLGQLWGWAWPLNSRSCVDSLSRAQSQVQACSVPPVLGSQASCPAGARPSLQMGARLPGAGAERFPST